MSLADDIQQYVDDAIRHALADIVLAFTTGTVATSPSAVSTDPLTVVLDGSAVAVPCKMLRAFPVFPGMRVALVRFGTDLTVIGSFTNPGAGTGQQRMAVGADTPPELQAYGIGVAMLMYDTDKTSGLEVGYFFIGVSNVLDSTANEKVMLFGYVKYPTPGDPTSPTTSNVHTAHQINLDGFTWFKDSAIRVINSVPYVRFHSPEVRFERLTPSTPDPQVFFDNGDTWFQGRQVSLNATEVWVHGRLFQNNERTIEADGNVTATATGTGKTLLPNTAITDITKELSGSRMRVTVSGTLFRSGATYTRIHYGVRVTPNGGGASTDYDIGRMGLSATNDRRQLWGIRTLPAIAAGSYTIQVYLYNSVSTGIVDVGGTEDSWFMKWEEIG